MLNKLVIPIKIYQWTSANDKNLFEFDADHINEVIYQDFTIEDAVNRIGIYILNHLKRPAEPFYIWSGNQSLLFDIKDVKWKGYDVNPFNATDYNSAQLAEPISYVYHDKELFHKYGHKTSFNIVFARDLPQELRGNKYYFSDLKYDSYKQYKKQDDKLRQLQNVDDMGVKNAAEYFTHIDFKMQLKNVVLADIFDIIHTRPDIDMIQWIDDPTRVLYKLSKKHRIKKDWFLSWTNIDKVAKFNVINIYSIVSAYGYCKISIDATGMLLVNYVFDSRSFTKMKVVGQHKKRMVVFLQNMLKQKVVLRDVSINAGMRLQVYNSNFKLLIKTLGEYINIFHIIKSESHKNKMSIICAYKRSSNFNQNIDIYDYIRSRIQLGLSKEEIVQELNNLGIAGNINEMIMGEMNNMASHETQQLKDGSKINIKNQGTVVKIETYSQGYDVLITNCPNKLEMDFLLYWLSKIIATTIEKQKPGKPGKPEKPGNVVQEQPKEPSPKARSVSSSMSSVDDGSVNYDEFDFDDDSMGGGSVGGAQNNYLIDMLQEADKELFANNYARNCQKSFQPVVISREQKNELERNNQMHFDNIVEYGSRNNNLNFYGCPRLWCPVSKVPLSPDDPNAKCPGENEEPMQMFAINDKNKKRYLKLFKPNEKGMCIPCCGIKPPKTDEINKCKAYLSPKDGPKTDVPSASRGDAADAADAVDAGEVGAAGEVASVAEPNDDEYYIMNQPAPIPVGRYGNIPEYMHNILFDGSVPFASCSKTLQKAQACFVRKGIANDRYNSIILVICDVLGFKNKKDFIKDVKKRLDVLTFLSLDNGNIVKQFMSMREIVLSDHPKLLAAFRRFRKNALWNLHIAEGDLALSRALNIFHAYSRYIDYISAEDFHIEKDPVHMYSLVMTLYDITLLVWEKDSDAVILSCPQQTYAKIDFNPSIAMIIKDGSGSYYEPLVFKQRGSPATTIFKINDYPKLKEVIGNCAFDGQSIDVYKKLYTYNNWVKTSALQNQKKYVIKRVFVNNDLSIDKMATGCGMLLQFPVISISLLPLIIKDMGIDATDVLFYDDIIDTKYDINVRKTDMAIFSKKCKELGITYDAGSIFNDAGIDQYSVLNLAMGKLPAGLMIHARGFKEAHRGSKKWYELQKMVVKTVLKKYGDQELQGLMNMNRESKIGLLMRLFDGIPEKKKIQIILEEIPTTSVADLKQWISNMAVQYKYNFLSSVVNEQKAEFVFSQNAFIVNGIKTVPIKLLKYNKAFPMDLLDANIDAKDVKKGPVKNVNMKNIEIKNSGRRSPADAQDRELPSMFVGKHEKLGTKWVMHKKSKWNNMVYIKSAYSMNSLPEFVAWLSWKLGLNITYDDVLIAAKKRHYDILDDQDAMFLVLQDQSYFQEWLRVVKKKFATVQIFWDNFYSGLTKDQRRKYLSEIIDRVYPNDLFIISISRLFNVSILTLHRGKYGKFDTVENVRGDLHDLILSSTLYPAQNNIGARPLIIFNKVNEKQFSAYYLVVDKNMKDYIYLKYDDLPQNVKSLTDGHLSQK
jgi:hypothetical protein